MYTMKKSLAILMAMVLVCLMIPCGGLAELSGWRLLDSKQDGNMLEVWFVTDEQVSAGKVVYDYGGIPLQEKNFSTMEGVGYIFIVDHTDYGAAVKLDPKTIVAGAVEKMSAWDSVAFVGVTQELLDNEVKFVAKGSWADQYDQVFKGRANSVEYTWEAISKAVSFAKDSFQNKVSREIVVILITDGSVRGKTKDADSCKTEIEKLSFGLPFYCLHAAITRDTGNMKKFTEELPQGSVISVTAQNLATIGAECVKSHSNLIYKSTLELGPEIYFAQDKTLSISLAGSQKGVVQESVSLNWDAIPSPTPEPTPTPTPSPTPELNPQYVGNGVGAEHDIWELQRVLIQLGFLEAEAPTGMWDPATAGALNLYYKMNNIGSDQIPARGGMTKEAYDALMSAADAGTVNTPTPRPTETPAPSPTPEPTIDPEKGQYIGYDTEDRSLVRTLNKALKEKYYLDPDVDGSLYGDATEAAVTDFYKDHPELSRPTVGEGITKNAYNALLKADPKLTPVPTEAPTEDPHPAYIDYDTTNINLIVELNDNLLKKFFVSDPSAIIKERYTEATNEGIKKFYEFNETAVAMGIIARPSTGVGITREAFEFLLGESGALPTATPIPNLQFAYDDESMRSADAQKAKRRLAELGYLQEGEPDDIERLRTAILWFEERNGLPTHEVYMDQQTFAAILSEDARPAEDAPEEIVPGAKEPAGQIKDFQDALKKKGYYRDVKESMHPGVFDDATVAAYKRFAEVNNVNWDGGAVSWESQQTVLTSDTENPALDLFENTKSFVTGTYEIFGLKIPIWALLAAAVLIVIAAIVVVVMLVKGRKKNKEEEVAFEPSVSGASMISAGGDEPTADLGDSGISTGADAPTADPEGCVITLMMTNPNGMSQDTTYNLADGDQLVIGRGSDADIVTDTADTMVSRKHGILRYNARRLYYADQSRHNTIVDGNVVSNETVELHQGSQLEMGRTIIKVQWS